MSRISIKINLRQLKSAVREMRGKSGMVECLVIPIEQNHLFEGEQGIYLDCVAYELKEKKADRKDTHAIKQSLPKDVYERISESERNEMPFIGNAIVWAVSEPAPREFPVELPPADEYRTEANDDLPF